MAWIQQVEKPNIHVADFDVSGKRWYDLDVALAEAVLNVVSNSLLREILYYKETHAKLRRL